MAILPICPLTSTSALVGGHILLKEDHRACLSLQKRLAYSALAAEARPSEELCRSAAAKLRRFLQNKRSSFKDLVSGSLIDPSGDNKAFDKGIDKGEGD